MTNSNVPPIQQDFSKLDAVGQTRDVAVTAVVLHALSQSGVVLSEDQRKAAYDAAENFAAGSSGRAFSKALHDAVPTAKP